MLHCWVAQLFIPYTVLSSLLQVCHTSCKFEYFKELNFFFEILWYFHTKPWYFGMGYLAIVLYCYEVYFYIKIFFQLYFIWWIAVLRRAPCEQTREKWTLSLRVKIHISISTWDNTRVTLCFKSSASQKPCMLYMLF